MAMKYTEEQLNTIDKSLVIHMLLAEQERTEELTKQVKELNAKLTEMDEKMQKLIEQVILSNRSRFGRSSEKIDDPCQLRFMEVDGNIIFFNETEAHANIEAPEPEEIEQPKEKSPLIKRIKDYLLNLFKKIKSKLWRK